MPHSLHEVPWLKIFAENSHEILSYDVTKFEGFKEIRRNDIVVFKPPGKNEVYVKRCVGLPGDHIEIVGDNLRINEKLKTPSENILYEYLIYFNQKPQVHKLAKRVKHRILQLSGSIYYANISSNEKTQLMNENAVDSVKIVTPTLRKRVYKALYGKGDFNMPKSNNSALVAFGRIHNRNPFELQPLYIPAMGGSITLNRDNVEYYRKIIEQYGNHSLRIVNGEIYIDNKKSPNYTFKQNYFFMLGDNRHRSEDSRKWGFVPEHRIIGKAAMILYSCQEGKMKWKRTLKRIND